MSDIEKEIEAVAETMEKSVQTTEFSIDLIKSTVLKLGPAALKKAVANLTPEQRSLLEEVLVDMKKSHKEPIKNKEQSLEPVSNSTPDGDYKFNEDDKPLQTAPDEAMTEEAKKRGQAEVRNQGGIPVEGWEGQVIKAKDIAPKENKEGKKEDAEAKKLPMAKSEDEGDMEKGGSGSGRKPVNPALSGVESAANLAARVKDNKEIQSKFAQGKTEKKDVSTLEDKKKMAKGNLKKMMSRMQERKMDKKESCAAMAKSLGLDEGKLGLIWDALAKGDTLAEKGNPESSQVAPPKQMKSDEAGTVQKQEDPSTPKYQDKAAAKPAKEDVSSGKSKTTADKGEQPPKPMKKSDSYFHDEGEPAYIAKSEANPFAQRTTGQNKAYHVDQYIEEQAVAQKNSLEKSTFNYVTDDEEAALAKAKLKKDMGADPAAQDVVDANAKKRADAKREDKQEVRDIKLNEKLSRIEGKHGPKMPMVKSSVTEMIAKSLDMDQGTFELAQTNATAPTMGGFLVKSFADEEMDALFEEQDMWKSGGPGSRGGKVIGHTRSGKPVYESGHEHKHPEFNAQDHTDAGALHSKIHAYASDPKREKPSKSDAAAANHHKMMSSIHSEAATKKRGSEVKKADPTPAPSNDDFIVATPPANVTGTN